MGAQHAARRLLAATLTVSGTLRMEGCWAPLAADQVSPHPAWAHGTQTTRRGGRADMQSWRQEQGGPWQRKSASPQPAGTGKPRCRRWHAVWRGQGAGGGHNGSSSNSTPLVLPALTCSHRSILRCHLLLLFRQAFTQNSVGNRSTTRHQTAGLYYKDAAVSCTVSYQGFWCLCCDAETYMQGSKVMAGLEIVMPGSVQPLQSVT